MKINFKIQEFNKKINKTHTRISPEGDPYVHRYGYNSMPMFPRVATKLTKKLNVVFVVDTKENLQDYIYIFLYL